jgi:lysozyme family protein
MANFKPAFDKTMGHEGGYANDPTDKGGETYRGISRRYHPDWLGWKIIDGYLDANWMAKDKADLLRSREADLGPYVQDFYKAHYWNPLLLDECPSQAVAEELFDTGVNMGIGRAGTFLRRSLNVLNKNGVLFPDLVEDGKVGNNTLNALRLVLGLRDGERALLTFLNVCQGAHYMDFMAKSPEQEKFAWGWIRRVTL